MSTISLFANGSSQNHGCEAILNSTIKIVGKENHYIAATTNLSSEKNIKNVEYVEYTYKKHYSILTRVLKRLKLIKVAKGKHHFEQFEDVFQRSDIAMSVGGDNYCYGDSEWLYILHQMAVDRNIPTVLYGCSIEESLIDEQMLEDLKKFDLIVAREPITYNSLLKVGLGDKVKIYPDPAFALDKKELPLPDGFGKNGIVGINISPLVISRENREGCIENNLKQLVNYILNNTDMDVLLVPHVVTAENDDREPLQILKNSFKFSGRVLNIGEHSAEEIKGYIARCRFFIGARTHATIAAYSSGIPTIVVGYSVKSRGIAQDIFGTSENYVVQIERITENDCLLNSFKWLVENESSIKDHLDSVIPLYCSKAVDAGIEITKLLQKSKSRE